MFHSNAKVRLAYLVDRRHPTHVRTCLLFSTDIEQDPMQIYQYYKLRFIDSNSSLTLNSLPEGVIDPSPAPVTLSAQDKAPQPAQREVAPATPTRQPQVFRVGEITHYSGAKGAVAVTCHGKELEVLNTRVNDQGEQECKVKASGWCASYWVVSRSLKKVR